MANVLVGETSLQGIAAAIRERKRSQNTYTPAQMAPAIRSLGFNLETYDYAQFDGSGYIVLPFTVNADYTITVDFYADSYVRLQSFLGNSSSVYYPQLAHYNGSSTPDEQIWTSGTGDGEVFFAAETIGRHTFITNKDDANYFDGEQVSAYTPITAAGAYLWIGGRSSSGVNCTSKICSFKIESISSGEVIANLVPAAVTGEVDYKGMFDTVNQKLYTTGVSSVGNFGGE